MIEREILIANTKTQRRSKITTAATTLGELKAALNEAGIDYNGMTFTEGISKTQLLDNATQLPQNVMYKGQPTNNLVILLTNTKKNIASGIQAADRQAAYSIIKEYNLQEEVKEAFGRNFTQVPTAVLQKFIAKKTEENKPEDTDDSEVELNDSEVEIEPLIPSEDTTPGYKVTRNLEVFISSLYSLGLFSKNDLLELLDFLARLTETTYTVENESPVSSSDGSITDDDIDDMINEMGI